MKSYVYSRWDGEQAEFSLDAQRALDALTDLLMEGLDAREALEWMRRHGFELAGLDVRVMGVDELIDELREQAQELYDRYRMDRSLDDMRRRLDDLLDREQQALRDSSGYESERMNEFLERRHAESGGLADAIERFREHEFVDEEAETDYRELLDEVDALRRLERFLAERAERFRGTEPADYDTAQEIRERLQAWKASNARGEVDLMMIGAMQPEALDLVADEML